MAEADGKGRVDSTPNGITRWEVLKGIGAAVGTVAARTALGGTAAVAGALGVEATTGAVSEIFAPRIDKIPTEVPPQLHLQRGEIPLNEHFRTPLDVIRGALDDYVREGDKPKPFYYVDEDEYLRQTEALKTFFSQRGKFDTTGKPYDKTVRFGATQFVYAEQIYDVDPGSSAKKEIEGRLTALPDSQAHTSDSDDLSIGTEREKIIAKAYADHFFGAKKVIDEQVLRKGEIVSTSELLKYFLTKNKGDIVQSLWDTTLFLKMAARCDVDKMAQADQWTKEDLTNIDLSDRSGAELISSMFHDEFSSEAPLEWLVSVVSPDDAVLNTDTQNENTQWKDFMPVNRAGTPYHIFNLATWAAVMSPRLVEEMLTAYYSPRTNSHNPVAQQGKIKVEADYMAAKQAMALRELYEGY